MKQTKTNYAKKGKEIALSCYDKVPCVTCEGKKKLQEYKTGSNKKIDEVLADFYRDIEINKYGNPVPIRIRKEEAILNLENLLN